MAMANLFQFSLKGLEAETLRRMANFPQVILPPPLDYEEPEGTEEEED